MAGDGAKERRQLAVRGIMKLNEVSTHENVCTNERCLHYKKSCKMR